jgi:hypothetical protein
VWAGLVGLAGCGLPIDILKIHHTRATQGQVVHSLTDIRLLLSHFDLLRSAPSLSHVRPQAGPRKQR